MGWEIVAALIAQHGLPFVERLIKNWTNNTPVTAEEWGKLTKLSEQTARSQVIAAFARAGIPENDPRVVAALAALPEGS